MPSLNESIVEDAAIECFGELGYSCLGAEALAPALSHGERESYGEVVLGRLHAAIRWLNPAIPEEGSGNSQGILVSTKHIERRMNP